ncbi:MAG: hypothetical protein SGPRY_006322, partial [Prymnesium sp.]
MACWRQLLLLRPAAVPPRLPPLCRWAHLPCRVSQTHLRRSLACTAGALLTRSLSRAECDSLGSETKLQQAAPACTELRFEVRRWTDILRLLARALWLGAVLLPPLALALPAYLMPHHFLSWLELACLRSFELGGTCMIKLGQWASTRNDVLPPSLCRTLSSLHDAVPAHAFSHTERVIEVQRTTMLQRTSTCGGRSHLHSMCHADKSSEVCAKHLWALAASLRCASERLYALHWTFLPNLARFFQVHEGITMDGQHVAVKVLHPHVESLVAIDVYLLRQAAHAIERLVPLPGVKWLSLSESIDRFSTFMASQLDLTIEERRAARTLFSAQWLL